MKTLAMLLCLTAAPLYAQGNADMPDKRMEFSLEFTVDAVRAQPSQKEYSLGASYKAGARTSLGAGYEHHIRSGAKDDRVGLGILFDASPKVSLSAEANVAPDAEAIATRNFNAGIHWSATRKFGPALRYRYGHFPDGTNLELLSPSLRIALSRVWSTTATYTASRTSNDISHNAQLSLSVHPRPGLSLHFGGGSGSEHIIAHTFHEAVRGSTMTSGQIGGSYSAHGRTFTVNYGYHDRKGSPASNIFTAGFSMEL